MIQWRIFIYMEKSGARLTRLPLQMIPTKKMGDRQPPPPPPIACICHLGCVYTDKTLPQASFNRLKVVADRGFKSV